MRSPYSSVHLFFIKKMIREMRVYCCGVVYDIVLFCVTKEKGKGKQNKNKKMGGYVFALPLHTLVVFLLTFHFFL